ncbi:MAG TPA: GNAT family N-acetyltransferase [Elusimicrobiota bacterium]|nr:GNAT family N-acetyltransferase [Elusimicrobiota bacterium]
MSLEILAPEAPRWAGLFERLPDERKDVFYAPEYARLAADHLHKDGTPLCAALETEAGFVLYPFLQRELKDLLAGSGVESAGRDTHGLYGRNGAVASSDDADLLSLFHDAFRAYCAQNKIVCGFDRFHPVMENQRWSDPATKLVDIGGFVVVDLAKPLEELEGAFKHAVRKSIKKAERAGIQVSSESSVDRLDRFLSVYSHTMQRRNARDFYYVEPAYYRAIAERLPGRYRYFYATLGPEVVSCELVMVQGHYCHSFLGGTLREHMDKCPNHILKREIIRWAKAAGCRHYLLGGGETPFNSIWSYKTGFAPEGSRPSFVGGAVYDQAEYDRLRAELERSGKPFPAGRLQFYDLR